MVRVGGKTFDAFVNYSAGEYGGDIELTIPGTLKLTDEELLAIRDAKTLEELDTNFGVINGVRGVYALIGWRAVENTPSGIRIRWQTYRTTDIEQIRQENEDLTQALLDLAERIGG